MATATRFHDLFMRVYQGDLEELLRQQPSSFNRADWEQSMTEDFRDLYSIVGRMADHETKRIIVPKHQATVFWELDEGVPRDTLHMLKWPFDKLYLEFDLPVDMGIDGQVARAILVYPVRTYPGGDNVTIFYSDGEEIYSQSFRYHLTTGEIYTRQLVEQTERCARFLGYLGAYMMANGIEIVEEKVSRQQKRLLARRKGPSPWHVIQVKPTIRDVLPPEGKDDGYVRRHGHRYDVMGHLRFGKHKLKDGTYRHTIEWVKPHQRGLRHEHYVPAIRKFGGNRALPAEVGIALPGLMENQP